MRRRKISLIEKSREVARDHSREDRFDLRYPAPANLLAKSRQYKKIEPSKKFRLINLKKLTFLSIDTKPEKT